MKQKYLAILLLGSVVCNTAFSETTSDTSSPLQMLAADTSANASSPVNAVSTTTNFAPSSQQQTTTSTVSNGTSTQPGMASITTTPAAIGCNYIISNTPSEISPDVILQWANYAATKTFTYDFQNYDKQFSELKQCYTTAGWQSFIEAMKASNNLKATQDEHLFVSAKVNGDSQLLSQSTGDTQPSWLVRIPLKVTYQNQDREVSQDMYIDLTIKTIYGVPAHLGINQIIASPKPQATSSPDQQNMPEGSQPVAQPEAVPPAEQPITSPQQ